MARPYRNQAAAHVDAMQQRAYNGMKLEHLRQEQSVLHSQKKHINSIKENEAGINQQYLNRLETIKARKQIAAQAIMRRERSVSGRLQGMTPWGRARQREVWEKLDRRQEVLNWNAGRQREINLQKHNNQLQRARISSAEYLRQFRDYNHEYRVEQKQHFQQNRPILIQQRMQEVRQQRLQQRRGELRQEWKQQASRTQARTTKLPYRDPPRSAMRQDWQKAQSPKPQQGQQRRQSR